MKNKISIFQIAILLNILLFNLPLFAQKELYHYISLPLIEGAGIYSSVKALADNNSGQSTKAASISNLSLLGTNLTLGLITAFAKDETRSKLRSYHRILGFTVTAAALWLSVSASVDKIDKSAKYVSYGYTGLTIVPLIMFSF